MLHKKIKERFGANVIVSTQDDNFFLMVDAILGSVVENVISIGSVVPSTGDHWRSEVSEDHETLAIIDISSSTQQTREEIDRVRKLSQHSRIILISRGDLDRLEPFACRVSAIIPFALADKVLLHVAHVVFADMSVVPGTVLQFGKAENGRKGTDHDLERLRSLSLTESRVMLALTEGLSNKQIARVINISDNTVRIHVRNIFLKLSVQNRTQAALLATRYWYTGVLLEKTEPLSA